MAQLELDNIEKRMRQKWYDLVMAEQQGAPLPALERMYNAYILTVEEYNHTLQQLEEAQAHPAKQIAPTDRTSSPSRAASAAHNKDGNKKKAS